MMKRNRHRLPVLIVLLGTYLLTGCAPSNETVTPAASPEAISGDWVLIEPASAFTTTLRIDEGAPYWIEHYMVRLTGRSAINTYSATASFSMRASIDSGQPGTGGVSAITATKVGGTAEAIQAEQNYFARLRAVTFVERIGTDKLRFTYSDAGVVKGTLLYKRP